TLLEGLEQVEQARDPDPRPLRETRLAAPPPDVSWLEEAAQDDGDAWLCKDMVPPPPPFAPAPARPAPPDELEAWVVRERARLNAEGALVRAQAAAESLVPPIA